MVMITPSYIASVAELSDSGKAHTFCKAGVFRVWRFTK